MSISVLPINGVDIRFVPGAWPMPDDLRASVSGRWAAMLEANPHIWDGRILGVSPPIMGDDGILRSEAREDAFSAFLTWREVGFPEMGIRNLFGSALIVSADGFLVLGVMGEDTANAGRIYPPGGSLEPRDVLEDGRVDVARSTEIELEEETGLKVADARLGNLIAVLDGPRVSVGRAFHFDATAEELLTEIRGTLDKQEHRELADVVAIRRASDAAGRGQVMPIRRSC
ncbi:NUDIX hydrolase [Devosia sp. LjRoot3]|uniref:NUDIX hydrolase n=1 Tax=Devosia sp. LjRoot3 TaxID=3342319 RepID=UPI003ED113E9